MRTAFLYTEKYFDYDYGAGHPLKIERLRLTYELCRAYGLFALPDATLVESEPATESEILRFHSRDYVELLKAVSDGRWDGWEAGRAHRNPFQRHKRAVLRSHESCRAHQPRPYRSGGRLHTTH